MPQDTNKRKLEQTTQTYQQPEDKALKVSNTDSPSAPYGATFRFFDGNEEIATYHCHDNTTDISASPTPPASGPNSKAG